ncbi:MAG: D-(-)-3-hydroxybutyrate oligomer hydrolase [Rubrivivax sp.]|nr:D-(-)-3-hydroxybutyrate oligomer hydrolase [Rubrivivax sp.]
MSRHPAFRLAAVAAATLVTLPALASPPIMAGKPNTKPSWLGDVRSTVYDGVADDLLTAGLGKTGLGSAFALPDPTNPTVAELRRYAIHVNYRAVLDITPGGGYGTLYGPNVRPDGTVTTDEGKIAGSEHIAYAKVRGGNSNVVLMVQVPASFDPARPCIVTGTSSGSRGIYGAIGSSGEWGLKRGCAVAYTDKGTGTGVHDLQADTVNLIDGTRTTAAMAGKDSHFTANLSADQLAAFNAATPNRIAVKHAHSQVNPEADWGRDTLRAVEFAFWVLNEQYGTPRGNGNGPKARTIVPENTVVIASSISNGGGAALAAAEKDRQGLIDGVAVTEPNVQTRTRGITIQRGSGPAYTGGSKPLLDYFTFANLYQPCAALSSRAADSPQPFPAAFVPLAQARCASLKAKGLLAADTLAAQAEEALDKLLAYGWEAETIPLQVSHWRFATPSIAMTYTNAHGRFSVADHLCGLSFAYTNTATGVPVAAPGTIASIFSVGNGVPPTGSIFFGGVTQPGINIVNNLNPTGAVLDLLSASPSTGAFDFNLDGAICQRSLITGTDDAAQRVQGGIAQVQQHARLRGMPTIIVHGRDDTLVPVNFSSRPFVAKAKLLDGAASRLSYVEVTNAQHFDAFLPFPDYAPRFVPLHVYFNRALDAMWAHLTEGAALPASQVVRTTPRGPGAPAITAAQLPPIATTPAAGDAIVLDGRTLRIPD